MRNVAIFKMVVLAFLTAVVMVMTFVPYLGFINYGAVSLTLIPIPVILGGFLLGWKGGTWLGFMFGMASWFNAFRNPGVIDVLFQNPLIAVFPRIIFGVTTGLLYNKGNKVSMKDIKIPILAFLICVFHSVLVISFLYVFGMETLTTALGLTDANLLTVLQVIMLSNGLLEALLAAIIVSGMYFPTKIAMDRYLSYE